MRDKESVTQIFILYGYEKRVCHKSMTHPFFRFFIDFLHWITLS